VIAVLFVGCLALACFQAAGPQEPAPGVEVAAPGRLFVARLAKARGQERVPDAIARWRLEVVDADGRALWSTFHPAPGEGERYRLAEDGSVFVVLHPAWSDARPVVTLRAAQGEPAQVYGGALAIPREALAEARPEGAWLAEGEEAAAFEWIPGPFGPLQVLDLVCVDGQARRIDLASGLTLAGGGARVAVWVEPPFEKETVPPSRVPLVKTFFAPDSVAGDEPLVVRVEGEHPNPGWKVFAFGLEPGGEDGRTLWLTPRARPPMPGGLVLQQVEPYVAEARIHGLPPGTYQLVVEGDEGPAGPPLPFEVRPGGVLAELRTTGGILGLDETVTLYANGVVQVVRNKPELDDMSFAPPRAFANARTELSRLPALSPGAASPGSDLMRYELRWRAPEGWREISADDGSARGEVRRAIDAVRALVQP
jgi:hypothetical protein